ncbi:MAG: hypothetical protein HRT95_05695 [Moritella sp.]|uniref:hypothetical protein n=1 Tax=Moritella sp. TaxID=78556 RepID=UPI001D2168F4|nr:hypothetical protein [Moritella sp.]NQZ49684.1 hypothetical protein [Moritella sp.]
MAKLYFRGCGGIENPVDMDGKAITAGDTLTFDWGDFDRYPDENKDKAVYLVERHKSGGFCAKGINTKLYLHDIRFDKTRKLN